uniref:DUF7623 domain-containing protein n=1 Tax=Lygus hesperus TaxID=30085 RepID=A0A0A9Z7Q5_LYGHE
MDAERKHFLPLEPQGIPLNYLPLNSDPTFHSYEIERIDMKLKKDRVNEGRLKQIEQEMLARVEEMARVMRDDLRKQILPTQVCGIAQNVLPLDQDTPFHDLEIAAIKAQKDGDSTKAQDLADALTKRAIDVAVKSQQEVRLQLGAPLGFTIDELELHRDKNYLQKEAELITLRSKAAMMSSVKANESQSIPASHNLHEAE